MALSTSEIKKALKEQRRKADITKAVFQQNWVKFHAETKVQTSDFTRPANDFLAFVGNILPNDKFRMFKALFRYPVYTNEVTATCFDKLSRIFDGRNPAFNYQFAKTELRDDWEWYRQDVLKEPTVWSTDGWKNFKTEFNSILVVDMPETQTGELPEPYFYWLPISQVLDYEATKDGQMKYLIFKTDDGRIAVIDDKSYRVFSTKNGVEIERLMLENSHDLGYCPAHFSWNESLSLDEPNVKVSPITKELEQLDWLLFYHISKRHLDLYGSYPIYSGYEQSCDYSNGENGDYCDGGFLKNREGQYLFDKSGLMQRCPKCGDKRIIGAGSFVEVPIPQEGQADLRNPVQMLNADVASLEYNVKEEERLKVNIITAVVGTNEEVTTKEAINEQQVKANFESQSTVLNRVKKGFEAAQKFVDETIARLRYGADFIQCSINYGTDFYLTNASELREKYKSAKDNGSSESELDAILQQIIETEYRHNPLMLQRMLILSDLEPYRHLTRDEVISLYDKGLVSEDDMRIKIDFNSLIRRFEREVMNVIDFGSETSYSDKINKITEQLKNYANENPTRGRKD